MTIKDAQILDLIAGGIYASNVPYAEADISGTKVEEVCTPILFIIIYHI